MADKKKTLLKDLGFTLLEIVVSIGIFVIIIVIIMGIFASFIRSERTILLSQELQREGAPALERIVRDIRNGGRPFTLENDNNHLLLFLRKGLTAEELKGEEDYGGKKEVIMYIADDERGLVRRKCPELDNSSWENYFSKCSALPDSNNDEIVIPKKYFQKSTEDVIMKQSYRTTITLKLFDEGEKLILQTTVIPGYAQGNIDLDDPEVDQTYK